MKKIIIVIFILLSQLTYSQARLGISYQDVKKEFSKQQIEDIPTNNKTKLLGVKYENRNVLYYFRDNKCICTIITTDIEAIAYDIVKLYDTVYTQTSSNGWTTQVSSIEFNYDIRKGLYTFTWK